MADDGRFNWTIEEENFLIDGREEKETPMTYREINTHFEKSRSVQSCTKHYLRLCSRPMTSTELLQLRESWVLSVVPITSSHLVFFFFFLQRTNEKYMRDCSNRRRMFEEQAIICGVTYVEYERVAHCGMTSVPQSEQDLENIICNDIIENYKK